MHGEAERKTKLGEHREGQSISPTRSPEGLSGRSQSEKSCLTPLLEEWIFFASSHKLKSVWRGQRMFQRLSEIYFRESFLLLFLFFVRNYKKVDTF